MKKLFIVVLIGLAGCTSQKSTTEISSLSKEDFLESPFGFKENIKNFSELSSPKFHVQKLLRKNKHYPSKTDTIYQFTYKNSEVFFYKTHTGKEFLLAGKIVNKQITLKNDIHVGIRKEDFVNRFSGDLQIKSDSLQMIGDGTKYTFVFDKKKLKRIQIDNYFD